jgi:hypothetical protein
VRRRFPEVHDDFLSWAQSQRDTFALGSSRLSSVSDTLAVFSMICQSGYGRSRKPRIRYKALKACLDQLVEVASERNASVHMPRIGCGQAGGSWEVVSELIDESLCSHGIPVTVYDLPTPDMRPALLQGELFAE